jgi:hypothetical protein
MHVLANVVGIYFHLYAIWVLVTQFAFLSYLAIRDVLDTRRGPRLCRESFRLLWLSFPAIGILTLICYAPVLEELIVTAQDRGGRVLELSFPAGLTAFLGGVGVPFGAVLAILVVLGLVSNRHPLNWEMQYFVLLFLGPLLVSWLILRPADLYPRFFIYFLPYYVLLMISGLYALWQFAARCSWGVSCAVLRIPIIILTVCILCVWITHSWRDIPVSKYRDAIQDMETDLGLEETTLCVIGGDAEMFRYYGTNPLVIPKSMEHLEQLLGENSEVRCAFHDVPWSSTEHRKMAEFLAEKAMTSHIYEGDTTVAVYTYRKDAYE